MKSLTNAIFLCFFLPLGVIGQPHNSVLHQVLDFNVDTAPVSQAAYEQLKAERSAYLRDWGVTLGASYSRRTGEGFVNQDMSLNSGQTYVRTGIDWDILGNGLLNNRNRAKLAGIDLQIEALTRKKQAVKETYFKQFLFAAYVFDKERLQLYQERNGLLAKKLPVFTNLNEQRYIGNELVIKLDKRVSEVDFQIKNHEAVINQFEQVIATSDDPRNATGTRSFQLPDINVDILIDAVESETARKELQMLQARRLDQESAWWTDVRLTASLDYNHQISFAGQKRDFTSVGLSVDMPLSAVTGSKVKRNIIQQKKNVFRESSFYELQNVKKELLSLYREYAYKLKQIGDFEHNVKMLQERIRVNTILRKSVATPENFTKEAVLFEEDDLLATQIELLDLRQKALQLLLKMNLLISPIDIRSFLIDRAEDESLNVPGLLVFSSEDSIALDKEFYVNMWESMGINTFAFDGHTPFTKQLAVVARHKGIRSYILVKEENTPLTGAEVNRLHKQMQKEGYHGILVHAVNAWNEDQAVGHVPQLLQLDNTFYLATGQQPDGTEVRFTKLDLSNI